MLVLRRKEFERIVFPDLGITLTVVELRRDDVKLGIEAPKEVRIYREEIWKAIERGGVDRIDRSEKPSVG